MTWLECLSQEHYADHHRPQLISENGSAFPKNAISRQKSHSLRPVGRRRVTATAVNSNSSQATVRRPATTSDDGSPVTAISVSIKAEPHIAVRDRSMIQLLAEWRRRFKSIPV